ncbi:MAG: GEVED domain-containing protein [Lishizhenia sp.]
MFSSVIVFASFVGHAQYCTNTGPTTTIDSNVESVSLLGDAGTLIYTGCPAILGLEDQTNLGVLLTPGASYILEVQFGTCGGNYAGAGQIWIDYNQNQNFEANESIGTWEGNIPTPLSQFAFTVPNLVPQGTTRMRVMHREGGSIPLNPCETYPWGSVVDFTVQFQNGIDCSSYLGNLPTDPIEVDNIPYVDTNSTEICYGSQSTIYSSADVFYRIPISQFNAPQLTIDLCNSSFDTHLTVFDTQMNPIMYNDDGANCGANAEITLATTGLDTILVAVEGWNFESGEYILTINGSGLSLEDNFSNPVRVFPNPVTDILFIEVSDFNYAELYDFKGRLVKRTYANQINIEDLSNGIYSLKIANNKQVFITKICKK